MTVHETGVLVVESDSRNARSTARVLIRAGFAVSTAASAEDAISILEAKSFQGLVLTLSEDVTQDLELVEWVRAQGCVRNVIVSDGTGVSVHARAFLGKGAHAVIPRPVDLQNLVKILRRTEPTPEDVEPDDASFSGTVENVDILSYVQFIVMSGNRTVLEIRSREGARGRIYVDQGWICHACAGNMTGESALYHCLSFKGGSIRSGYWSDPKEITIVKPADYLLFEAARMRDEAKCLQA